MKAFVFNLVDTHLTKYFRIKQSINRHQVLTVTTVKNTELTYSYTMFIYKTFCGESGRLSVLLMTLV